MKWNILRCLVQVGCRGHRRCPAPPPPTTFWRSSRTASSSPTAPATPSRSAYAIDTIRELIGKKPIFGICLGHQLLGLALGGEDLQAQVRPSRRQSAGARIRRTGQVEITTQNHGFAVEPDTLPADVEPTHINLNDQTLEGMRHKRYPVFSVQYHPEASAGPHDSSYLFEEFRKLMD